MRGKRESCVAGCDILAAIYESVYGKAPMYMTACEAVIGLRAMCSWEERIAAVVLLNEVRK